MPLYTFDKLGSAKRAARAGVEAREAQVTIAENDIVLKLIEAYWGAKLAGEIITTIEEGQDYIKSAQAKVDEELESGEGEATVTDQLRLKTYAAEIQSRWAEATKLKQLMLSVLSTLANLPPGPFDVDAKELDVSRKQPGALEKYLEEAMQRRPELRALHAALRASQAKVSLEQAGFFPNLLLVANAGVGYASTVDDPKNAFLNDPFNFYSAGMGFALQWNINIVQQLAKLREAAAEANRSTAQLKEASTGVSLELQKNYLELEEAQRRLTAGEKGHHAASSWLVASAQNLAAGLAEPKELTDALVAYFQIVLRHLQAIFDVNVGWARLARATGMPVERFGSFGSK